MRAGLRKEDVRMSDQENREYTTDDILALPEGVREYWIVDPAREAVVICRMEKGEEPVIYPFTEKLVSGVVDGLKLDIQAV